MTKFGGNWKFQAKYLDEETWTYYDRPLHDDLVYARDLIFRKYQRRRASSEDVEALDQLLLLYAPEN